MKRGYINSYVVSVGFFVLVLLAVFVISSCKEGSTSSEVKTEQVKIPSFNADTAYANIQKQLSFGFRIPGTPEHRNCGDWAIDKLNRYGASVIEQNFEASFLDKSAVQCRNIMAQFNPSQAKRILLAAHYDSRSIAEKDSKDLDKPIMGADDGASGVGVLIEIARVISENPINLGVDILLFDAEDQGKDNDNWALGSQYWSNRKIPNGYKARYGILLDMVGSENATFGKEEYSMYYAEQIVDKVWTLAARMGYSDFFQDFAAGSVMDDHFYVNRIGRIRMIDIINMRPDDRRSFGTYHHTHRDNIDIISKRTLKVVGQVVTALLYKESEESI